MNGSGVDAVFGEVAFVVEDDSGSKGLRGFLFGPGATATRRLTCL